MDEEGGDRAEAGAAGDRESAGGPSDGDSAGGPSDGAAPGESAGKDREDEYGGLLGAFPYALRSSSSLLFRSYVVVGGLAAALIALLFGIGVLVLIAGTAGSSGGTLTFSRAFFVFVGLLTVAPVLAPVLAVARRHRRGTADATFDARMAALGYAFLGSLYLALVVSAPAGQREEPSGALAPIVEFLYSLPPAAAVGPPLVVVATMWYLARR